MTRTQSFFYTINFSVQLITSRSLCPLGPKSQFEVRRDQFFLSIRSRKGITFVNAITREQNVNFFAMVMRSVQKFVCLIHGDTLASQLADIPGFSAPFDRGRIIQVTFEKFFLEDLVIVMKIFQTHFICKRTHKTTCHGPAGFIDRKNGKVLRRRKLKK